MRVIQRIRMPGLLSFPPDMDFFDLQPLNVLIGPNGSGKSNFIDTLELLHALPTDLAAAVREGGGAAEWLWKGSLQSLPAAVEVEVDRADAADRRFRYRLSFAAAGPGVGIVDELIDEPKDRRGVDGPYYYFHQGRPEIHIRVQTPDGSRLEKRTAQLDNRSLDQSVLAQRKDPDFYPELFWLGAIFGTIRTLREWTFGPHGARQRQRTDLPAQQLLPDASNLALVLNQVEHTVGPIFNDYLKRFFPRFKRMTTAIEGGTVQLYLHESGLRGPDSRHSVVGRDDSIPGVAGHPAPSVSRPAGLHRGTRAGSASGRGGSTREPPRRSLRADAARGHDPFRRPGVGAHESTRRDRRVRSDREARRSCVALTPRNSRRGWRSTRSVTCGAWANSEGIREQRGDLHGGRRQRLRARRLALRRGMDALLGPLKQAARNKSACTGKLVPCGPRGEAFRSFRERRARRGRRHRAAAGGCGGAGRHGALRAPAGPRRVGHGSRRRANSAP